MGVWNIFACDWNPTALQVLAGLVHLGDLALAERDEGRGNNYEVLQDEP